MNNKQIQAGAVIHAGDGGYSIGTREKQEEFAKTRAQSLRRTKFETLIGQLKELDQAADQWLDTVPREINSAFFDNPYVDTHYKIRALLLEALYDGPLLEEVDWFLYEWDADKEEVYRSLTYPDGTKCVINNVSDFCDHLEKSGYFEYPTEV